MGVRRKKAGREAGRKKRKRGREGEVNKQTKNLHFSLQTQLPGSGLGNI